EIERLLRFGGRESELELDMRCRYAFGKRQAAEFLQGLEVAGGPGQAPVIGLALRSQCRGGQDVEQGLQGCHQCGVAQEAGLLKGGLGDACVLVAAESGGLVQGIEGDGPADRAELVLALASQAIPEDDVAGLDLADLVLDLAVEVEADDPGEFLLKLRFLTPPAIRSPRGTPWDVTAGVAWQALFARRVSPSSPPVASVRAVRLPDARPGPIRRFAELATT